jgi:hypothetical protein
MSANWQPTESPDVIKWDKVSKQWCVSVDALPVEYDQCGYPADWIKRFAGGPARYIPVEAAIWMIENDTDYFGDGTGDDPRPELLAWLKKGVTHDA